MWKKSLFLFFALYLPCAVRTAEAEQWYLIQEPELRSIEEYRKKSEQEKQTWLLQVSELKADSKSLNDQLQNQRELNQKLTQSFNEYEQEQLTRLSLKNGEIAALKENLTGEKLKFQKSRNLNIILGGILGLTAVLGAVYLYVKIRTGGLKFPKLFG
jgi:23S rRNA pseudoU1915 N3-methylase RlmH